MSSRIIVTNQEGQVIVPAGKFGKITDVYVSAIGAVANVVLYEGAAPDANTILSIHSAAEGMSTGYTNMGVQFSDAGVYALVDPYTSILTVWGEWAGGKATAVLSGG